MQCAKGVTQDALVCIISLICAALKHDYRSIRAVWETAVTLPKGAHHTSEGRVLSITCFHLVLLFSHCAMPKVPIPLHPFQLIFLFSAPVSLNCECCDFGIGGGSVNAQSWNSVLSIIILVSLSVAVVLGLTSRQNYQKRIEMQNMRDIIISLD